MNKCAGWALLAPKTSPTGQYPGAIGVGGSSTATAAEDLAVANGGDDDIGILLGKGDGTFAPQTTYPVGPQPGAMAVGDFNRDGKTDLAVINGIVTGRAPTSGPTVGVLLNQGHGILAPQVIYPVGAGVYSQPTSLAVGDIDADGNADLAFVDSNDRTVSALLNRGDGAFDPQRSYPVATPVTSLAIGPFDDSGRLDFAVTNFLLTPEDSRSQPIVESSSSTVETVCSAHRSLIRPTRTLRAVRTRSRLATSTEIARPTWLSRTMPTTA